MLRHALVGAAAGAVGTAALNIATYADMALRGRAASSIPEDLADAIAKQLGVDLAANGSGSSRKETAENRRSGIGALMGYVTGLGVGTLYGAVRPQLSGVPLPVLGVGVALAAMAMSDAPATAYDVTDPTSWGVSDWGLDFGFHLAYGLATVVAFEALAGE